MRTAPLAGQWNSSMRSPLAALGQIVDGPSSTYSVEKLFKTWATRFCGGS
jgi:hypothetical protein